MVRISQKEERQHHIMDACEQCIITHGVSGVTLDRVAEEAGLGRTLIRHNMGNRDNVLALTIKRFEQKIEELGASLLKGLTGSQPYTMLVRRLFIAAGPEQAMMQLATALTLAASDAPAIAATAMHWHQTLVGQLSDIAQKQFPRCSRGTCEAVSIGIMGIWSSHACLTPLSPPDQTGQASLVSALMLIAMLEIENGQ